MTQQWADDSHALADMLGVVKLGRSEYAVSLIWNSAEGSGNLAKEAREAAQRIGTELIALRPKSALWPEQYALGDVLLGHRSGQVSLAAAVAEQVSDSLYGVWCLEGAIWCLIGVRADRSIVYDRTLGVGKEAVIRAEFEEGLSSEAWAQVICPGAWGIPGSLAAEDVSPVLGRSKVRLRAAGLNWKRWLTSIVALGAAAACVWYGYQKFTELQEERRSFVIAPLPTPEKAPPLPWVNQPRAAEVLRACVDGLLLYAPEAAGIPGWTRTQGSCDGLMLSYELVRKDGSDNWVTPMAARLQGNPTVRGPVDGRAALNWSLPLLARYGEQSPGTPLAEAKANVQAQFNELLIPITWQGGDSTRFWQSAGFTISVQQNPMLFLPLIGMMPGSLITEVRFDPDAGGWVISGLIYERLRPNAGG